MMDFSGSNRGYLFVRYASAVEAKCAQQELNNFEIRPGKYIGVIPSVDNRKLWISGIPKNRGHEEIKADRWGHICLCLPIALGQVQDQRLRVC